LLSISGTADPDQVSSEIEKQGLDTLADRPGDLLELAGYWRRNGHFGSLSEMVEQAIESKLAEQSGPHSQGTDLTPERARHGAERLAAALTLGKTWTLHAPDLAPELRLSSGSLDPMVILPEWSDPERQALLRRGIFAPATYGRVRFHHRGTQEYLTASWLTRLLGKGCPKEEVWNLLFAERYGVRTLVPSLHAVAAWLAVGRPDFREEILRREPLVLLRYGDPRSLPIDCRERLLLAYAERDLAGDISDDGIDHRSLALLAAPELHDTVRQCWNQNRRVMFRLQLLRLMREGAICGCSDLARGVALDTEVHDYLRITSVEALASCADTVGLSEVARWLVANASRTTCRVAAGFCKALFPRALSVADLLNRDIVKSCG
jgi:hypothetical protein